MTKLLKVKLPDGRDLEIVEGSFLTGMHKFLSDAADVKPRSFVFENLNFDGTALKNGPETETAMKAMSTLLKAFPNVVLQIDGHTDKGGDAAAEKRASLERANAVKEMLVKVGMPDDRMTTEGQGAEKPIAPHDTEENRAKNRRIEVTIVK
jgi:outer membrane protein OmpA-like peptidoglycan-associated protein